MPLLYRVVPYLAAAGHGEPGHPLHVPASTGANRIDNPDVYHPLYLGDDPRCAVAEAFGWAARWGTGLLRGSPSLPGSVRALVAYELAEGAVVCNLDDAARLERMDLRPSQVVTRERSVTQAWARRLFDDGGFVGVRWWSFYNPEWGSVALWNSAALTVAAVDFLGVDHPTFVAAAAHIVRSVE